MGEISGVKLKTEDNESGKMDELGIKGGKSPKFRANPGTLNMKRIKEAFKAAGVNVKGGGFFNI